MPDTIVSTTIGSGSANAVELSGTDSLFVTQTGAIYAFNGWSAVLANTGSFYNIANVGSLFSESNVITANTGSSGKIDNAQSGYIYSANVALFIFGDCVVRNDGEIVGYQTIRADNGRLDLVNRGVIRSTGRQDDGGRSSVIASSNNDFLVNQGVLEGDVFLGSGDDFFTGVGGTLRGSLRGNLGFDTVSFAGHDRGVFVDFNVSLTFDGLVAQQTIDFESAIGTAFGDSFFGSAANETFDPGPAGADFIGGYGGIDTVTYASSIRTMIIDLTAQQTFDGVEADTLVGIENATGSRFNDLIFGDGGANVIDGGADGADTLNGLGGNDTVSYASSQRNVIIDLSANASYDGVKLDQILNFENAIGSSGGDTIYGDGAANTLDGGGGLDTLFGGGGADRFIMPTLAQAPTSRDIVGDFTIGTDKLVFSFAGGYTSAATFTSTLVPTPPSAAAAFLYSSSSGQLFYDADGTGVASAAVLVATLTGAPALTFGDLQFVA